MQEPSIFTKIINGEISAHKIYEDDRVIAILDTHPVMDGHVLVIPKAQIDHIWDLGDDDYHYLFSVVKKISEHMREVIGSPRIGMMVEGFGVPHAHVHLIPIYVSHDLKRYQDYTTEPDNEALTAMAEQLKM